MTGAVRRGSGQPEVELTNPSKVLWPSVGFTKLDLAAYYASVAAVVLPHLADRPLTLHRFPDGVDGRHWYETRCPPHPGWLRTQRMHSFRRSGKVVDACLIDDERGLQWAAQVAAVELHPYLASAQDLDRPRVLVFDLDPGAPAATAEACAAALDVREQLDRVGLHGYPKLSGAKGAHVFVPLEAVHTFADTKRLARAIAATLVRARPDRYVDRMERSLRSGKVFIDWGQNDPGKSTVAPYSLRGMPLPTVSAPLTWGEVEQLAGSEGVAFHVGPRQVLDRLGRLGDVFAPVLTELQTLPTT